ncbi:hypothetical protein PGTUg99_011188 [Puccinia graminis f. sp. tritici]|uniref:Uncharacterized protein n=1 Tax=Puccinia graminis f. sp. tritici TaxID=56615 RepID=A0A5B0QE56_PUCGR|nr:hypothetical protein PGTUg99_011188 [Puccinia graminis f. sp. tritici]
MLVDYRSAAGGSRVQQTRGTTNRDDIAISGCYRSLLLMDPLSLLLPPASVPPPHFALESNWPSSFPTPFPIPTTISHYTPLLLFSLPPTHPGSGIVPPRPRLLLHPEVGANVRDPKDGEETPAPNPHSVYLGSHNNRRKHKT